MILPVIRWWTETVKYFGFLYNQCVYFKRKKVAHNLLRLHSSEKWYCMWFLATEDNAALFRLRMLSSCKCMSGIRNWLFRKTKAYRNHYMTTQCVTSICVHNIFHLYSWLSNMYKIGFCFQQTSICFWNKYNSLLPPWCVGVNTVPGFLAWFPWCVSRYTQLEDIPDGIRKKNLMVERDISRDICWKFFCLFVFCLKFFFFAFIFYFQVKPQWQSIHKLHGKVSPEIISGLYVLTLALSVLSVSHIKQSQELLVSMYF